jgi:hypothetical protein
MTYTFKLAKRMAIIWQQAVTILRFTFCCLLALVSWYKEINTRHDVRLGLGFLSVVIGDIKVRRLELQHPELRRQRLRNHPRRRVSDKHPVQEFHHPWHPMIWQFVFVGIVRVTGD